MNLSPDGLRLIEGFESLRLDAYPDPGSRDGTPWTIGWGATTYEDGTPVREGDSITAERADELLRHHLANSERDVRRLVTVPLSQRQYDALVSFQYNTGALAGATLLRRLNAGDYAGAAQEFDRWIHNDGAPMEGLRRRRRAERAMFADAPQPTERPAMAPAAIALVPALLNVLAGFAPELAKLFTDKSKSVSERNVEAGLKAIEIARQVAATASAAPDIGPAAAVERIAADPAMQAQFRTAVQERWYELTDGAGGGVEGARKFAAEAMAGDDWRAISYGVAIGVLSIVIVVGGGALIWRLLLDPGTNPEQRGMLIGAVVAIMGAVVSFFFGSSVSSRNKDNALARELGGK